MKKLAKMNPDEIRKGLSGIAGIFTILIAVMAATRLAGKQAKKAGVGILAISASLILIALSIKMIARNRQQRYCKRYYHIRTSYCIIRCPHGDIQITGRR